MNPSHSLDRFIEAQTTVYADVRAELAAGRKRTHWMWFIFPQLKSLGRSVVAVHYGIESRAQAAAYLEHSILGPRLIECTKLVNAVEGRSVHEIFGSPDDMKFLSCMTLFETVANDPSPFASAIEKFYGGRRDARTLELLGA